MSRALPQAIKRLSLDAFRNYDHLRLEVAPAPVILTGENGAGKTNLLEAISLLSPGRGLHRAAMQELFNKTISPPRPWAAAFTVEGRQGEALIGIGADPDPAHMGEKRLLRIDGKPARSQGQLAELLDVLWLTPEMDRLLCESASERRRFMDRLAYALDHQHGTRINRHEDAMRQRLKLLRDGRMDDTWLRALEDSMARDAVAIAAARLIWLDQLRHHLQDDPAPFPRVALALDGAVENLLQNHAALDAEERLRTLLKAGRTEDAASGMTHLGTHRSDLAVHHIDKNAPADQCSTGEQKALLISLMLAQARLLLHMHHTVPLVLLDDITAHLDEKRRAALARQLLSLKAQAWLTGTDTSFFKAFGEEAQFFTVSHGFLAAA